MGHCSLITIGFLLMHKILDTSPLPLVISMKSPEPHFCRLIEAMVGDAIFDSFFEPFVLQREGWSQRKILFKVLLIFLITSSFLLLIFTFPKMRETVLTVVDAIAAHTSFF